jgi:hypothetical protein
MPIYRGSGGSGSSNNSALANQVTLDAEAAAESAANAATSATNAATSATDAATSATNAANSATSAATSSGSASTSATTATTKASEAATSATAAATSATTAATEASNAGTSATTAGSQATIATTKATEAAASATTATTKATEAATSATASATSATASATSATASATSATASAASATAAAASAAAAAASQEAIDGLYLGAQSSDPTLDLNGDPVTVGDWYFNTTINKSKIYNGSSWDILTSNGSVTSVTGTGTVNGVTLTGTVTTAGNLTLGGTLSGITASQLNSQNISQWTNDSGYITSYTETDTLDSVTDRGDTTTNAVTVGNLTSTGIDDNATSTAITIDSSQNVGIGTGAAIGAPLHVDGSSSTGVAGYLRLQNNNSNVGYTGTFFSVDPTYAKQAIYARRELPNGVGPLIFAIDSSTDAADVTIADEKMRIDSSGNVGIGATSPSSYNSIMNDLVVAGSGDSGITIASGTSSEGSIAFADGTSGADAYRGWINYNHNSNFMRFFTNATERMRIGADGNVGIGTGSGQIAAPLHVDGVSSTGVAGYLRLQNETANTGYTGVYFSADPTYAKQAIYAQRAAPNGGGSLIFAVDSATDAADVAISDEKIRIDSSGNLLVGTTVSPAYGVMNLKNPADAARWQVGPNEFGNFVVYNQSAVGVYLTDGGTSWTGTSDERLKENINDIGPVLETIKNYQCVNFSYKANQSKKANSIGFIAQDWENDFPNVIETDDSGYLGIKYTETIPVLLKAIQEQQAMIEELKAEVAALKGA